MNKKPNPERIEEENPEWTDEMFKQSVRLMCCQHLCKPSCVVGQRLR